MPINSELSASRRHQQRTPRRGVPAIRCEPTQLPKKYVFIACHSGLAHLQYGQGLARTSHTLSAAACKILQPRRWADLLLGQDVDPAASSQIAPSLVLEGFAAPRDEKCEKSGLASSQCIKPVKSAEFMVSLSTAHECLPGTERLTQPLN